MNTIEEVKSRLDIVDIISENVKLRKSGKNYVGFCPFHTNTRTPAFVVFPDTGTWRCFGECNDGGDIFKYVMKREGYDFREALKVLAERAGVQLEPLTPERIERDEHTEHLRKILEDAVVFFRYQLANTDAGKQVREHLAAKRGIQPQTEELWELGYAPNSWDASMRYLTEKGYTVEDILEAGLLTKNEEGKIYDRFRHRIIFPIRDLSGKMSGFGGRVINPDDIPKYLNSPQSPIFDKSGMLYGMDKARKEIRRKDQAVIVEGYFDAILVYQEGFQNVISPMGTALTEKHMRQLKRYTRNFILALDPDAAGQKATIRGLEVAREALDHTRDLVFDAKGLIHHESRLQADLRVCTLPEGLDPDEIVLRNAAEWENIINQSKPIIYHVLDSLTQGKNINDPKTKSDIAAKILPLVQDVADPVERNAYHQQIARVLRIDEKSLMRLANASRHKKKWNKQADAPRTAFQRLIQKEVDGSEKVRMLEREVLQFLIHDPESIYQINRFLQSKDLERISSEEFLGTDHQEVAEVILSSLRQTDFEAVDFVKNEIENRFQDLLKINRLEPNKSEAENSSFREVEETIRLIMQIRLDGVKRKISDFQYIQENRQDSQDSSQTDVHELVLSQIQMRGKLDRALAKPIQFEG